MGKEHKIKKRIRTVRNINQITKAMEMTAASKLRRSQEAALLARTYAANAREALARLRLLTTEKGHPLFTERAGKSRLMIVFSSDRGLAGSYNSNIFKMLLNQLIPGLKVIVVGQKGAQFVTKLRDQVEVVGVYTNWPVNVKLTDIRPIATTAVELFTTGQVDHVSVLYTDFESTIRQVVRHRELLPIDPVTILPPQEISQNLQYDTLFEPDATTVLEYIVPRLVEVQIYQASLEAIASEQAMRMMAMRNASDNAKELVEGLTLSFNSARQAVITQQLAEISAGAEVVS
ncbi:MAG: ATP synthase F1 subunit gamma [Patescibacteria group bacterium]